MGRIRKLVWPNETVASSEYFGWHQEYSNVCLDFHGHPGRSKLVLFVDNSLFYATNQWLKTFYQQNPAVKDIFYATIAPSVIYRLMQSGGIRLGNLDIQFAPHLLITYPSALEHLQQSLSFEKPHSLTTSQGNVLLVARGNPKKIATVKDLMRPDVRIYLPHPANEKEAFKTYFDSLSAIVQSQGLAQSEWDQIMTSQRQVMFGEGAHHREAPLAVYEGRADVAVLYYHLAYGLQQFHPDHFDIVCLGEKPRGAVYHPGNICHNYQLALLDDQNEWAVRFVEFVYQSALQNNLDQLGLYRPGTLA